MSTITMLLLVATTGCLRSSSSNETETTRPSTTGDSTAESSTTSIGSTTTTTTASVETSTTSTVVEDLGGLTGLYFMSNELLKVVGRPVGERTLRTALEALLLGPTDLERAHGITSYIPSGTTLLDVQLNNGSATIDLTAQFASGGGSLSMMGRIAEVVFTATSFDEVKELNFRIDGQDVSTIGGEGVNVAHLTRLDCIEMSPLILVDAPLPFERVGREIEIVGVSNTFEAVINYQIFDSNGTVLLEGNAMATSGTGTWGTFDHVIEALPDTVSGEIVLRVFEYSAKDGSPINIVEIPLSVS